MRCVVVKSQVMVYDRIVCVVGFEQMLQGSRALLGSCLDIVYFDRGYVDCLVGAGSSSEERWQGNSGEAEHCEDL